VRNCGGERHAILFCTAVWHRNGGWLKLDMFVDLSPLAEQAGSLAIRVMDLVICGQQNIAVMRRRVAR